MTEPARGATGAPVDGPLSGLLPGGRLRPGTAAAAGGDVPLLLALAADAVAAAGRAGHGTVGWAAVGLPELGALAAADAGLDLGAGLWVDDPGGRWPAVLSALLEAVPVVLVGPGLPAMPDRVHRRLAALQRRHGTVLVAAGAWPGAAVRLTVVRAAWEGVKDGHGLLRGRRVTVAATGRGAAAGSASADLWLPGPDGRAAAVEPAPVAVPAPGPERLPRPVRPGPFGQPVKWRVW